ncbi:hypothetical protein VP01_1508g3 [Puccinia sorghi]|uniref:C2H2-type domain-containing protein n=1 Tax=Puccinia sorghi TaxID=27349 RepID=A0A0L6VJ49_9BASI|nr:hypothetical protein VP01_1508g3 [Puccinia sorghi]
MALPNPLPQGQRKSSPFYPDTWVELTPSSLSYGSAALTMPAAEEVSSFDLKSYCAGLDANYVPAGPGEILLPLLEDPNIYSLPMGLPQEPSYKALESTIFKSEDMNGGYQQCWKQKKQCNHPSPNFLISTPVDYESSLSPSSSRPCTAGYEVEGMGLSSSVREPPFSLSYGCGFPPNDGFPFYSHLDQAGVEPNSSPKAAVETNHNDFPLQYMTPYILQQSNALLGPQEDIRPLIEPAVDLEFPASTITGNNSIPMDIPEKYPWSAALSHPARPRTDGPFAHSEVFTTRYVQPTSLLSHQALNGKPKGPVFESNHAAYGKASFLPGNWETQSSFCNENMRYPPQTIKRGSVAKKRPRRKNPAGESLPRIDATGSKLQISNLLTSRSCEPLAGCGDPGDDPSNPGDDPSDPGNDPSKHSGGASRNKTPDGKFVCIRISKETQEICGRKFQRSEHLKRHWATHDKLKPYKCHICERYFGRTDNLTQHIKTHENVHGRNTKLLRAKLLQKSEQSKGLEKIERKPTAYASRASRRRKAELKP